MDRELVDIKSRLHAGWRLAMSKLSDVPPKLRHLYAESPAPHRDTMLTIRELVLSIVPHAEEIVSYGMPAFRVDGVIVCGIKAARNHVGYYPFSGSTLMLFESELQKYSKTKSALHVPVDKPLSRTLLKKLVTARLSMSK